MSTKTEPIAPRGALLRFDARSGVLSERGYTVTVLEGPDAGRSLALAGPAVVGSDEACDLVLRDGAVSRRHVELTPRPDGVALRDLESTNGVHVAGVRVSDALVEGETVLVVGRTKLRIAFAERDLPLSEGGVSAFGNLVGRSAAMQHLFRVLQRVASASSNVVLHGETGTGKDVIARAIHDASERRLGPFVVLDCGAVAPALVESELFGHARGAFTGALAARAGAFELADGGTIFLDEIGELPLELQPRLLRALEASTIKRVGETAYRRVDVRVVAASHRDLAAEVTSGRFRSDLFYRLSVMLVRVPPLRERGEDIPLLVEHFVRTLGREVAELPPGTIERFSCHPWPGNVRELRNEIERALVMRGDVGPTAPPRGAAAGADAPDRRGRVLDALGRRAGNQTLAAQDLGISRRTLLNWLDELGIPRPRKGAS
jgi:transcriptional regulator with GAF, ATPase, and Fis domain